VVTDVLLEGVKLGQCCDFEGLSVCSGVGNLWEKEALKSSLKRLNFVGQLAS
jgi:hypothetical protein